MSIAVAGHPFVTTAGTSNHESLRATADRARQAQDHRPRRGLLPKYALLFGALVVAAVLGASGVQMYAAYELSREALARIQREQATGAASRIEQFLDEADRSLAAANPVGPITLNDRRTEYLRLLRTTPAITELAYYDDNGNELLRVSRLGLNIVAEDADYSRDPRFLEAKAGRTVYGPLYFKDGSEPYVTLARPAGGLYSGVTMAEVNLKFIWDVISRIPVGRAGHAYVVDSNGVLIAHPDITRVLRRTDLSGLSQIQAARSAAPAEQSRAGVVAADEQGRRVLTAYHPISGLNWWLLVEQPFDEAFAPLLASLMGTVWLLAGGVAVALLVSILVARQMVRPIAALRVAAARIGAGALDQRIDVRSGDELEDLANEFNQMSDRLRASSAALEQTTAQRERIEQELRIAHSIQQTLLPRQLPSLPGWRMRAHYAPARQVGGDFYDVFTLADGRLGLVIGDVSDKGVPAALYMATTRTVLRSIATQTTSPGEVLARANELLCLDMPANMFVTALYAILDPKSGHVVWANAGHDAPYRRRGSDGVVEQLRARGMPLGLMPGMAYEERETVLEHGDVVLAYSDGLIEAHNPRREMFGQSRVLQLMSDPAAGGTTLVNKILGELGRFTGADWQQEDDLTVVVMERTPEERGNNTSHEDVLASFSVASVAGQEREAMERVAAAVDSLHMPKSAVERLKSAVAEATMNAIEHGNHFRDDLQVQVEVAAAPNAVRVRVTDQGGDTPIPEPEQPDLLAKLDGRQSPRGWGLFLIKNLVDQLRTSAEGSRHTVELVVHR